MTSISSVEAAGIRAAPKAGTRYIEIDRARSFLTLVVVLHHAVIPYTYFGHTDATSWIGFDAVVLATDSFFMAMFFFLSGLFVWPSLTHKAPAAHLRDRLLRLGLPFAIAAVTGIPLAYYAIALRHDPNISFAAFWWKMVTIGPWPSGPIWFVWVLFAFDLVASLLHRLSPRLIDPITRLSQRCVDRPANSICLFWRSARSPTFPRWCISTQLDGSSLGRSRSRPAASCFMRATSSSAQALALPASIVAC